MSGITPTGFEKRTLEDLLAQVEAEEVQQISSALDVSASSPMGQINAVLMKTVSELWDLAQAIYDGFDPDKNEGDAQDAVCAITGTKRIDAAKSYTDQTLALNAGVTVPAGAIVSVLGNPGLRFVLVGPEPATGDPVVPGDVTATTAGNYHGRFQCDKTGAFTANAGTVSVIVTPVSGWNSTANAGDAIPGRDVEGPSDLRLRRVNELQAIGTSPVDAIRGELLKLDGMIQVTILENVDDATDGNNVPPHSFEAVCFDGASPAVADNDIAQTLWDSRAGGIRTAGASTGTARDSQGAAHTMSFSRPSLKTVYFDITLNTTDAYPGDSTLKTALVAYGRGLAMGQDVVLASFYSTIFGVGGVTDITLFKAGFSASPSGTSNLTIAARELATFDTARITVHS